VYDGTATAAVSCTVPGVVVEDVVACSGSAIFDTASVGSGKTVTVSSLTLTGVDAGNYTLTTTTATTTAAITALTVTPAVTVASRLYNGTMNATVTSCTVSGQVAGDVVACSASATFDTASVGTGKTVTVSGLTLTGTAQGNYTLAAITTTTTAAINAASVTPTVAAGSKMYDGTTDATLTSCTLAGLITGDVVDCSGSAIFDTASVGAGKTVTVSSLILTGAAAVNYALDTTTATTTAAIMALPVPGAASPLSPTGTIIVTAPAFSWSAVPFASYYALSITDSNAASPTVVWYTPAQAGCGSGTGACSTPAPRTLNPGLVTWGVITWNASGYGPWSTMANVVLEVADASVPTPATVAPFGPIATRVPTYSWSSVSSATWYQISVKDALNVVREYWYTPAQACVSSCAATPNVLLSSGQAQWKVRAWRISGAGAWSGSVSFITADAASAPPAPTLVSPSGAAGSKSPSFRWNAASSATLYYVMANDSTGSRVASWLTPSQVGCASGGVCTLNTGVTFTSGAGSWQVIAWNPTGYSPWSLPMTFIIP
jgi:hypothetical protein